MLHGWRTEKTSKTWCPILAKCALIKADAAPLSDLCFTVNTFQLSTVYAFTVCLPRTDCKANTDHEHVLTLTAVMISNLNQNSLEMSILLQLLS